MAVVDNITLSSDQRLSYLELPPEKPPPAAGTLVAEKPIQLHLNLRANVVACYFSSL